METYCLVCGKLIITNSSQQETCSEQCKIIHDGKGNSDRYVKLDSIEKAVEFYKKALENGANTISTRRID